METLQLYIGKCWNLVRQGRGQGRERIRRPLLLKDTSSTNTYAPAPAHPDKKQQRATAAPGTERNAKTRKRESRALSIEEPLPGTGQAEPQKKVPEIPAYDDSCFVTPLPQIWMAAPLHVLELTVVCTQT